MLVPVVLLAGCGDTGGPATPATSAGTASSSPAGASGVQGRAVVDAGCPVLRDQTPCPDRPLQARIVVTDAEGATVVKEQVTTADGAFRVDLPPGRYRLSGTNLAGAPVPIAAARPFVVEPGAFVTVQLDFDSGVR